MQVWTLFVLDVSFTLQHMNHSSQQSETIHMPRDFSTVLLIQDWLAGLHVPVMHNT